MKNFSLAIKNTLQMAGPVVGARVSSAVNAFLTMLLISRLGHAELAAGALINSVYFALLVPLWQLFYAIGILVGQNFGAQQYRAIGAIVRQGLLLGILVSIPTVIILWHIGSILILLGQDKHLADLTQQFFHGYAWSVLPGMWYVNLVQTINGMSKQKLTLFFTILYVPFIICIGDILMFGKFGLPRLGIIGMGYANAVTFLGVDLIILAYLYCKKEFHHYQIFTRDKTLFTQHLKDIISIGWPISLMVAAELLVFSLSTIFIGWLGESPLAAWQITLQINLVAFMFPMGIGQASTILISQEIGRKNYHTIRNLNYASLLLGMICTLIFCVIYWVFPRWLIAFYLDVKNVANSATLNTAITLLSITAIMNIFDTLRSIAACSLRGLKDTIIPMIVFIVLGCILSLPIGYILGFPLHFGAAGMRWGFTVGFAAGAIILLIRAHQFTHPHAVRNKYQ